MKKHLFLLLAIAVFASCQKGGEVRPGVSLAKITISSPDGNGTYTAGDYVDVRWNSKNLPKGSYIAAEAKVYLPNGVDWYAIPLKPQTVAAIPPRDVVDVTADDGEEIFRLPSESDGAWFYQENGYGRHFKISLYAVYPNENGVLSLESPAPNGDSKDLFTINPQVLPDGCSSTSGYSTTTGQPCNVPVFH
jgi:hypothetical protein